MDFEMDNCSLSYSGLNLMIWGEVSQPNAKYPRWNSTTKRPRMFCTYICGGDILASTSVSLTIASGMF